MVGIWTAVGLIGGAVIGGIASSKGAKTQAKSAAKGLEAEERISDKNLAFQRELEAKQREDFKPWRAVGQRALVEIERGIASGAFQVGHINLADDPGYRVRMQEGIDALDSSASARGRLLGGAHEKALTRYGQEQGSKEYANAYARESNERSREYNMLSNLNTGGINSAARQGQATQNLAQTGGNIFSESGRAQNLGNQAIGNARATGYYEQGTIANRAAQNWLSYKQNQKTPEAIPEKSGTQPPQPRRDAWED